MKLAVFDFDSTLMDGETIDLLASAYGVSDEVSEITQKTMQGELDFFDSLIKRVSLLKSMPLVLVDEVFSNLPLMLGASEILSSLKRKDYKILIFSGGFYHALEKCRDRLEFDLGFANFLHHKDELLTGYVGGEMMFNDSKGQMLCRIQKILNISKQDTLCVGDGANDLSMFKHSGIKIAFGDKEILKQECDFCVNDLREILKFVK